MHDCSPTTRPLRAVFARLTAAALLIAAAGCQSNSERDLIARDRRLQEDQIFALQDYVNQYQKLVCRYRAENCELRRQLGEGYNVDVQPSEPQPMPPARSDRLNNAPRTNNPRFQPPAVKPKTTDPKAPPLEEPAIPPLKSTTSTEIDTDTSVAADDRSPENTTPKVVTAAYEEPASTSRAPITPITSPAPESPAPVNAVVRSTPRVGNAGEVLLMGEIVANESGGGPRIAVDIVPFDASGRVGAIDGNVSLMLLTKDAGGQTRNLGRWDYNPEEVRAAVDPSANESSMRFFLELPAGVSTDQSTELWARIVPREGAKSLAHAVINLNRPSTFCSRAKERWASEETVVAASYQEPVAPADPSTEASSTPVDSSWAVAEPGKPANLPAEIADTTGGGGWRASSEPMPAPMATSVAVSPPRTVERPRTEKQQAKKADATQVAVAAPPLVRPSWSPQRGSESAQRVAERPSWSATR